MAASSIRVEGLRETVRQLESLGADKAEILDAGYQAATMLIREAMPLVPLRSGALRNTLRPGRIKLGAVARAGSAKVPYANPIHWGWFVDKQTGVRRNVLPQPFFSKALGYSYQQIIADYNRNMQKLVDKHLGKDKK